MEKSLRAIILLSIPIIIVTTVLAVIYAPSAFLQQCKHQATQLIDNLYKTEGSKEKFTRSAQNQNLSEQAQVILQRISNIENQCPELGSLTIDNLDSLNNSQGNSSKQEYQV
jgi:hypothetical protein